MNWVERNVLEVHYTIEEGIQDSIRKTTSLYIWFHCLNNVAVDYVCWVIRYYFVPFLYGLLRMRFFPFVLCVSSVPRCRCSFRMTRH